MADRFKIIQEDAAHFRQQILRFWDEYLPGTPPGRLDWMENNPAGPAIWLFAVEEKSGDLAGMISLFPKELRFDGKKIKAAVLGDIMVHKRYRGYGAALNLIKAATAYRDHWEFEFIYTIPNMKSKYVVKRAKFVSAGRLYSMMRPQRCDFLLGKYVGNFWAKILEKPLLLTLDFFSRATYVSSSGIFEEADWHDNALNVFLSKISNKHNGLLIGEHSNTYLDWRYRQNPHSNFKIFSFRENTGEEIIGLCIFAVHSQRLELYDIAALDNKIILAMIKKLTKICKEGKCRGVYSSIYVNNPLLNLVKTCCFFDAKDLAEIYIYPYEVIKEIEHWAFTSADRNI